ncbi:hypothetical protein BJ875DRAFT_3269 [Amylocarpus encephaloides]|uniref:Uncharacterized protein n=1 Tax=Amylocarpus encephaloides TaxID=45428 RepID=A0A9P7YRS9_9HELO|nr:hypothetical protein BJ875DRAFT_3269 [Amylocarpus encephaloides]
MGFPGPQCTCRAPPAWYVLSVVSTATYRLRTEYSTVHTDSVQYSVLCKYYCCHGCLSNESTTRRLEQSTNQPHNHSTTQPLNHSTTQPINQSTNQPINHSTNQPLSQSTP